MSYWKAFRYGWVAAMTALWAAHQFFGFLR